ncbi:MAG: dihydroorotase [Desulfatibacillum sp.]|nr:dihydroorotase [Desulfatibacillum sp.]
MDIIVADGRIHSLLPPGHENAWPHPHEVIDVSGLAAVPGLVDMHVHLREPGQEHKETIETGTRAAVTGGFTAVCCMPNTTPANDSSVVLEQILTTAQTQGHCRVYPACAITRGLAGEMLVDFAELVRLGAVAFTDDGMPVKNPAMMRRALESAAALGVPILSHCEEISLVGKGLMNHGPVAEKLGCPGIPNTAESRMVERDIDLCRKTGASLHICHVSTEESVLALEKAKDEGLPVTAETAPHYFTLTDEAVAARGANAKMNPPLRSERDRQAIRKALAEGTIDAIATDHAPHSPAEKDAPFESAPNGIVGLETSLALSLALVREGVLSLPDLIMKMSVNPARILGLAPRGIREGAQADITFLDLEKSVVVDPERFVSKSRNTPFSDMKLTGAAAITLVDGKITYRLGPKPTSTRELP